MTAGRPSDADIFRHAPEVDSLRAIAMIAVLAMHAKLLPFGWAGVWLFFVISGYVVTLSIVRRLEQQREGALSSFYERRAARIMPVYYLYVAAGLLLGWILAIPQDGAAILSLFGLYQNAAMIAGRGELDMWPTGHLWSISVEMQFYLVYGIVAHRFSFGATRKLLWFFVFAAPIMRAIVALAIVSRDPEAAAFALYAGPALHFDSFAMGCLLAMARFGTPIERLSPPLIRVGVVAIFCYMAAYVGVNILLRDRAGLEIARDIISGILFGEGREIFLYSALGLFSLAILVATLAQHPAIRWLTERRVLQWIGAISYGAYIFHAAALRLALWLLTGSWTGVDQASLAQRLMAFGLGLVITLIAAQLSYRLLEQPIMQWMAGRGRPTAPKTSDERFADPAMAVDADRIQSLP